jgi:Ran GTPase-activating protein (RanGAP) involved in mRNA processing and transport
LQEAILLKHAIQSNPQLSVLKLGYNDLRDAGVVVIAQAFQCSSGPNTLNDNTCNNATSVTLSASTTTHHHHASLAVLDLGFNNFGNAGVEALAVHALAGNYILETLYLSGNDIGPNGAFSIAAAILHGTGLCTLHLAGNHIGAVGIKAIAGAIAESDVRQAAAMVAVAASAAATAGGHASNTITGSSGTRVVGDDSNNNNINSRAKSMMELHVGNANVGSAGFLAIPAMLLTNITLRSLSVTNNGIDDQAMLLLSQALSQNKNVPLETMHFSFNEITDQGVECLMNAVWGSKFLRNLKLDNNKIQDRGAQLCAVVLTSIPLHVLDLSYNRVTTTGIKALMRNISENDSLHTLGMSGIPIDQHASKAVSFALAYNSSLNVLYLDDCSAGYSAQRHVVAGVVSNRRASLRVLTGFALARTFKLHVEFWFVSPPLAILLSFTHFHNFSSFLVFPPSSNYNDLGHASNSRGMVE